MTGPWAFVWERPALASAVAALCAVAVLFVRRTGKMAFGVLSGLASTLSACLLCILSWGFCLGALTAGAGSEEETVQAFLVLMAGLQSLGFALFAAFSLFLGLTGAYALALCWHILCRNRDDFGRDYYSFALSMRARQAFCAGLLLTVSAAAMFWLTPVVDAGQRALALLPFAGVYASHALTAGMLCRPLATLLWYAVTHAALPMQKRSLAFLALCSACGGRVFRARPRVACKAPFRTGRLVFFTPYAVLHCSRGVHSPSEETLKAEHALFAVGGMGAARPPDREFWRLRGRALARQRNASRGQRA